jgi:hypothetical protein
MTTPLVLVVAHRWVETVDAVTMVYLTICNNNGNKARVREGTQLDLLALNKNKVTPRSMQDFLLVCWLTHL